MALLSYNLIEKIIDVAESYAKQEKARMSQLDKDGKPLAPAGHGKRAAPGKSSRDSSAG